MEALSAPDDLLTLVPGSQSAPSVERLLARAAAVRRRHPFSARLARVAVMGVDTATAVVAMTVAFWMTRTAGLLGSVPASGYADVAALGLPVWLLVFERYRLYNARHIASRRDEVGRLLHAVALSSVALAVIGYALGILVARYWLIATFVLSLVGFVVEREILRALFNGARRRGHLLRPVAVAGTGEEAVGLATMLSEQPELGYRVVAVIGDSNFMDPRLADVGPVLDPRTKLAEQVRMVGATGVMVATTDVDHHLSNRLIRVLTDAGIHVELSSSLKDIDADRISIRPLGRVPVMYVEPVRRHGWRPVAKRAFDLVVGTLALVLLAPVFLAAALAIKLTSPGPVFFSQERVGCRGRRFGIAKFRSMYVDADRRLIDLEALQAAHGPVVKMKDDPRVTRVGKILRATSIDELPQIFNVLRGEMSLVGPRPEQPAEVMRWTPELFDRLRVKPGMTGMWQVSGRSQTTYAERYRWDLYYVDNWSLWRDLAIIFKTVPVVIAQKGAY